MHAFAHRPLVLVLLVRMRTKASLRLLCGVSVLERLPDRKVNLVTVHDALGDRVYVCDQTVHQVKRH